MITTGNVISTGFVPLPGDVLNNPVFAWIDVRDLDDNPIEICRIYMPNNFVVSNSVTLTTTKEQAELLEAITQDFAVAHGFMWTFSVLILVLGVAFFFRRLQHAANMLGGRWQRR